MPRGYPAGVRRAPEPWQAHGACQTLPVDRFYSPDNERGLARDRRVQAAKLVCSRCPVLRRCRDFALRTAEPYGVWGGLDERERADLRRAARIPTPRGTEVAAV
ncbi:WhiB family transcriptional regulator, redox-sensing transcriptional regulator [Actinokineospora terrae]|uniref:Transcriptional regulator WhiB n=1 Tax=Actinokineospora terrae TaxID=155974 RepID=A0A1H9K5Y3_9PSEU|nr:WhiB family transcriptional regulator [Actinokineospora terrae]SEQ94554.1 WhiB family transcriptional regulator, redox-sensing transcriptional regulator [Actinokineospora terrae]